MATQQQESSAQGFVHLHLHTEYSMLDGGNRVSDLVARVKELGMDAVAITDHGNLHGAVDFYSQCTEAGIKPILGIEAYVAPDLDGRPSDRTDRTYTGVSDGGFHLVLLAENHTGWQNLLKLSSDAFLHGFYFKPRMDKTTLSQWNEGLIAINGHLGSSIAHHLVRYVRTGEQVHWDHAVAEARWHAETFGTNADGEPRFYIELQRHVDEQEAINPYLIKLARQLELPLVCDNDAHFLTAEDYDAHDALVCISTGKLKDDENRLRYPTDLYVKSPEQMREMFAGYGSEHDDLRGNPGEEALANTRRIADRCNVELDFEANHAPVVKIVFNADQRSPGDFSREALGAVSEHPVGSTPWFNDFCAQYELLPYDSQNDTETADELAAQCDKALADLVEAGAIWRYGPEGITEDIRARIDRELKVLSDKHIAAYFLICWDFVNYARSNGIACNARGSGVGTMVGYVLGLSNACPVQYGLLFERFTDPDRAEYPDIDIDIDQDGRADVIDYVRQKYGHVAQIITFGTLKARAVIRDVGRVMDIPLPEVDRIAKLVPADLNMTLDKALEAEPELNKEYNSSEQTRRLIDVGRRLEGLCRHASVHAAAAVVATQPLENIIPLYRDPRSEDVITQWDGPTAEKVGLLKMDFLGLRTLSVIERAKTLVRHNLDHETQIATITGRYGPGPVPDSPREFGLHPRPASLDAGSAPDASNADSSPTTPDSGNSNFESRASNFEIDPLDLERLTFVDQNVLDLFRRGETAGVFQFESGGMRNLLTGMQPDRLNDLIAANALFRPGPMDLIPNYNDRKLGRAEIPSTHPIVDKHTAETYGVMVYQEQVMQIIHELGGIPLREAYTIVKAISKKKHKVIDSAREKFLAGAQENGQTREEAEHLFELILKFAGYGFNKSHSTGYAIVAYQTAFLKTYFPLQYMAALLTYESVNTDKVTEYIEACRRTRLPDGSTGIHVKPPDINRSYNHFTVVYDDNEPRTANHGHIRFGLGAVKGVGSKAVDSIIEARDAEGPFTSLYNFCERVPHGLVTKSTIEALIKCGAFDELHSPEQRPAMIEALDSAMSRGAQEASLRSSDDFLFGAIESDPAPSGNGSDNKPDPSGSGSNGSASQDPPLPDVAPWDTQQMLAEEKAVLGFYVSSHPLDRWRERLRRFTSASLREARSLAADTEVTVAGMISRVRTTFTRAKQERMAILTLEDLTGDLDAVAFPRTFTEHAHLIQDENIVFLAGKIDRRREEPNLIIDKIIPAEEAPENLTHAVRIVLRDTAPDGTPTPVNGELNSLRTMLRQCRGNTPVYFDIFADGKLVRLHASGYPVAPDPQMPQRISALLKQPNCCELLGPQKITRTNPAAVLSENDDTITERLQPSPATADDETCASIDRY